jgi:motility quorum-sensing regulator/GCU-specific mRNA interferase toxin
MEKRTPHCKLPVVKRLVGEGKVRMTRTALVGAAALGFDALAIIELVKALVPADFVKSMTTYEDHKVWQDVYRPRTSAGEVYLKLTVIEDVLIVSFKEL